MESIQLLHWFTVSARNSYWRMFSRLYMMVKLAWLSNVIRTNKYHWLFFFEIMKIICKLHRSKFHWRPLLQSRFTTLYHSFFIAWNPMISLVKEGTHILLNVFVRGHNFNLLLSTYHFIIVPSLSVSAIIWSNKSLTVTTLASTIMFKLY